MKKVLCIFLFAIVTPNLLTARELTVTSEGYYQATTQQLLESLTAYEETCSYGCKYRVRGLKVTHILEKGENSYILWQKFIHFRQVLQYVAIKVERLDDSIVYNSVTPDPEKLDYLKKTYKLPHDTALDYMNLTWTFTDVGNGYSKADGRIYVNHNYSSGLSPIIKGQLEGSMNDMKKNFQTASQTKENRR